MMNDDIDFEGGFYARSCEMHGSFALLELRIPHRTYSTVDSTTFELEQLTMPGYGHLTIPMLVRRGWMNRSVWRARSL